MCFSVASSFASAAILTSAGIAGMRFAANRSERHLSAVPFLFGVQQGIEGFVWLGLTIGHWFFVLHHAILLFLVIAWIAWPLLIPLVFNAFTPSGFRKVLSFVVVMLGISVAVLNAQLLVSIVPWAEVQGRHIRYFWSGEGVMAGYTGVSYVIATLLPPFLTGSRKFYLLGSAHVVMFLLAWFWARPQLISVWCFFAAISSVIIVCIVIGNNKIGSRLSARGFGRRKV